MNDEFIAKYVVVDGQVVDADAVPVEWYTSVVIGGAILCFLIAFLIGLFFGIIIG